jgi:hypothetical protein
VEWRQSFRVTSDATADGVRTIRYTRPPAASRSARYNLERLNLGSTEDIRFTRLSGYGEITIQGDRLSWSNGGSVELTKALARPTPTKVPLRLSFDESFEGSRPARR